MSTVILRGNVSFVNHEKKYIIIEYEENGKKKVVNGKIDEKLQRELKASGQIKKTHHYHIGDTVTFNVKLSDRGDRMIAANIRYLYNTALDLLIDKAGRENNFIGYLKIIDDRYFVKEIDSYLFFRVPASPWLIPPTENELNEAVTFSLENLDKKEKITAKLFNNKYIPEFYAAVKAHKSKSPIAGEVYKVSPYGIFLNLFGNKIQSKLRLSATKEAPVPGDKINVIITHIGDSRIVVEPVP